MTQSCRACQSPDVEVLLDFGAVPLAGGFLAGPEDIPGEQRYPLVVHMCRQCALIQIMDPIDPDILFQDYSFSTSTVPGLVRHFDDYAGWLAEHLRPARVLEFGCNDGALLGAFERRGVASIGVDVSKNITEMARERGHEVITGSFTPEVAAAVRDDSGPVDLVTGSNVFAHNHDPETLLRAAREVLTPGGRLCLEVMYAGDLFEQLQWDTLYHEHLTFYALAPLATLLERNGFRVVHAERIPMHGGSLRVVATTGQEETPDSTVAALGSYEGGLGITSPTAWREFATRSLRTIDVVADVMGRLSESATIWGYGAAGKATMWVNLCRMEWLQGMVDASPLRAGRLMPGTHTPIVSPEEFRSAPPPDFVFVTAWNYLPSIRTNEAWYEGKWVTPLPALTFS